MLGVLTPDEMNAVDRAAPEPADVLIERAGRAVARCAIEMLGGTYGRRVVVVCGHGNNGADGRIAARVLSRRGVRVQVFEPADVPLEYPRCDLVIDAAFGTGLSRPWSAPDRGGAKLVLAVDIPSGVDGLTGALLGAPLAADVTITFAAHKPGLLFPPGREYCGHIRCADIGLETSGARTWLLEDRDLFGFGRSHRPVDSHKWKAAVWLIGGAENMRGAARMASSAAMRAGAGYVRLSSPTAGVDVAAPSEIVQVPLPSAGWGGVVAAESSRFGAVVIGPGLGRDERHVAEIAEVLDKVTVPVLLDGDALTILGPRLVPLTHARSGATILTPHDGEFAALTGAPPGPDRVACARTLAAESGAIVLLKGPCTVIAEPNGDVMLSIAGDQRLATAGTGDVLAGVIGALAAQGMAPAMAAGLGSEFHGRAAMMARPVGMIATDLIDHLMMLEDPQDG